MVRQVSLLRLVSKGIIARMSTALYYTLTCLASEAMKLPQRWVLGRYLRRGEGKPAREPQWCSLAVSLQTPVQAKTCFYHLLIPLCCKKGEVGNYRKRTFQQEIMQMQHYCIFKAHKFLEAPLWETLAITVVRASKITTISNVFCIFTFPRVPCLPRKQAKKNSKTPSPTTYDPQD